MAGLLQTITYIYSLFFNEIIWILIELLLNSIHCILIDVTSSLINNKSMMTLITFIHIHIVSHMHYQLQTVEATDASVETTQASSALNKNLPKGIIFYTNYGHNLTSQGCINLSWLSPTYFRTLLMNASLVKAKLTFLVITFHQFTTSLLFIYSKPLNV